jgi:molybdenum cofactor cytidylyltransferase
MADENAELPVVTPEQSGTTPADSPTRTAGVLLAAGRSSRFGKSNKLLTTIDGTPIVNRAAETLRDSAVERVVVVLGHEAAAVQDTLGELAVETVNNDRYDEGQATSVATGVRALRSGPDVDAAVFALGDMPAVAPASIDTLLAAFDNEVGTALAAAYEGVRGNPVLFDHSHFDTLAAVEGDTGGQNLLFETDAAALIETGDPGVCADVDEPADIDELPSIDET